MYRDQPMSVNASILYKNQEICTETNLWKFQLILLCLQRETVKMQLQINVENVENGSISNLLFILRFLKNVNMLDILPWCFGTLTSITSRKFIWF